jgi:glycerophosphoryl diester phosphodiesterase
MNQTLRIRTQVAAAALFATAAGMAAVAVPASAQTANPWLENRFLNMAHQGGELEAPSNTMYALESAIAERGADSLEIDVNATSDDRLVVIHNETVDSTTDGEGRVEDKTAAEIQALDAAHWFVPGEGQPHGHPAGDYLFRGVRTGAAAPPAGYSADDFVHPTLEQVLDRFPDVPINIEIKGDNDNDRNEIATLLANVLTRQPYASREDIIVVSFNQVPLDTFHGLAPDVDLAASEDELEPWALDWADGSGTETLPAGTVALQVPPTFGPIDVPSLLLGPNVDAHGKGYAVHVWTNGEADEDPEKYRSWLDLGVDGVMTQTPGRLHEFLCSADVPRPDGSARCQLQASLELPRQKLKQARKRGIRATPGCSGPCAIELVATVKRKDAKRADIWPKKRRGKTLELGTASIEPGASYAASDAAIKLRKRVARKLRRHRGGLRVSVAATADWVGSDPVTVERTTKLKGKKRKRGGR